VEGKPIALHPLIRQEVYRIAREAVINAFRHSEAGRIEVEIKYAARSLRILVRDNGCGVDPEVLQTDAKDTGVYRTCASEGRRSAPSSHFCPVPVRGPRWSCRCPAKLPSKLRLRRVGGSGCPDGSQGRPGPMFLQAESE